MLIQKKLDQLDKNVLVGSILVIGSGETIALSQSLFDKLEEPGRLVLNATHRPGSGGAGHSDSTSLVNLSAITLTNYGG